MSRLRGRTLGMAGLVLGRPLDNDDQKIADHGSLHLPHANPESPRSRMLQLLTQ